MNELETFCEHIEGQIAAMAKIIRARPADTEGLLRQFAVVVLAESLRTLPAEKPAA